MSRKHVVSFEVGGQDIDWHINVSKGFPGTLEQPPEDPETEVVAAMLNVTFGDGKPQKLDILDLIVEVGGGEIPDHIMYELEQLIEGEDE